MKLKLSAVWSVKQMSLNFIYLIFRLNNGNTKNYIMRKGHLIYCTFVYFFPFYILVFSVVYLY